VVVTSIAVIAAAGWAVVDWTFIPMITPWVMIVLLMEVSFLEPRRAAARIVDESLRAVRCPACGYDLHGLAKAADGCTVCPECAAAWRLHARQDEARGHVSAL